MSTELHFVGKVAQKALITKNNMVLICRATDDPDIWELPGGRLHTDEDPTVGVAREIKEELGVDVDIQDIVYVEQFKQTKGNTTSLFLGYRATLKNADAQISFADGEIAEIKWITKEQIDEQKFYNNCYNALKAFFTKYA